MTVHLQRLHAAAFGDRVVCTGAQIADLLELVDQVAGELRWYVADVQSVGATRYPRTHTAVEVETAELMTFSRRVSQFDRGRLRGGVWTDDDENPDLHDADVAIIDAALARFKHAEAGT